MASEKLTAGQTEALRQIGGRSLMPGYPDMNGPRERRDADAIDPVELVDRRIRNLKDWLIDNAPYCATDQKHLDEHSPERAYWHFGYLMALKDVRRLLAARTSSKSLLSRIDSRSPTKVYRAQGGDDAQ